jgi:SecD/SecF fusion protein
MFATSSASRRSAATLVALLTVAAWSVSAWAQAPSGTTTTAAATTTTAASTGPALGSAPTTTSAATAPAATTTENAAISSAPATTTAAAVPPTASPAGGPLIPTSDPAGTTVKLLNIETKPVESHGLTGALKTIVILGVFILPIILANVLSKSLRMPDHVWRFFFVLFAVTAGSAATYFGWPPKLGVDLQGGVNLIYEISHTQNDQTQTIDMDKLIGTISKRINPGGIKEVTVRPFGLDKIEIIIPGADADELARIKKKISSTGALEFRILASRHKYQNIIDAAEAQERREESGKRPKSNVVEGEQPGGKGRGAIARWIPVEASREMSFRGRADYATRDVKIGNRNEFQVLCVIDPFNVTGDYLVNASPGLDQNGGHSVNFRFNSDGANRFLQLTSAHTPDPAGQKSELGIVLDGYLQSAPSINQAISDSGEITGNFTAQEVKDLSEILTAGGLPAALNREPVSELLTGPSLGEDTIRAGVNSMIVATAVVIVFMLFYYRFAGLVANIALIMNVMLTVAFMIMFNAPFTLSGLAGLALTVGMAVDANVLIYERMREELSRGATLRMAIRNGFDRASITIIDANVTTLITAIVLYAIGTDQIRGFAVSLTVGLLWNLFTAITVSRLLFEAAERNRWVSNLKFMQFMGATNFDFIGKRYLCYSLSIFLIGAGIIGTVIRGSGLLNIDFTGGVSITTVFEKPPAGGIAEVREKIESKLPEATVQQLRIPDRPEGVGFKIVTSETDQNAVENEIKELFGQQLAFHHLKYGALTSIAKADEPAAPLVTPAGAATPKPNEGSSIDTASDENQLAAACGADDADADASPQELLLAQATTPTSTAPTAPAPAATGTTTTTSAAVTTTTAATTTTPSATPAATAKPASPTPLDNGPAKNPFSALTPNVVPEPAVDPFAGGTLVTLNFDPPIAYDKISDQIKAIVQPNPDVAGVPFEITAQGHELGSSKAFPAWDLRVAESQDKTKELLTKLEASLAASPFFPSSEDVGAAVAGSAKQSALVAMIISLALVMAYVWFRFQNIAFGFAAILALLHDVMFTIGCLALSLWLAPVLGFALVEPFKIDLTIVAALLTIIGYSINDTIVIFDRIREVRGKSPAMTADLINTCVNQTLSRTILTSLTVFMVVVILYIWGGPGIHGFAFALVVGTISGTYSTIYVASPVLLWLHKQAGTAPATNAVAARSS